MSRSPSDDRAETTREPVTVVSEALFDAVLKSESRVLVDFHADWCGPCQEMDAPIAELGAESGAPVLKVDVESVPQLAARFTVQSIPTFLVFENGAVSERFIGVQEKAALRDALED